MELYTEYPQPSHLIVQIELGVCLSVSIHEFILMLISLYGREVNLG